MLACDSRWMYWVRLASVEVAMTTTSYFLSGLGLETAFAGGLAGAGACCAGGGPEGELWLWFGPG